MSQEGSNYGLEEGEENNMQTGENMERSPRKRHLPVDNTHSLETKFAREAEKIINLRVGLVMLKWITNQIATLTAVEKVLHHA